MVAPADAAVGKKITATSPPNSQYPAEGLLSLVDGKTGTSDRFDPEWMGWWYQDKPLVSTIGLGASVPLEELGVRALRATAARIMVAAFPRLFVTKKRVS